MAPEGVGDDRFQFWPAGGSGQRVGHPPVLAVDLVQLDRVRHRLTIGFLLTLLGSGVLHLTLASRHVLVGLVIATLGAVLFGGVLGALQWLVVRERVPVPRRRWIVANIGPALLAWLLVILPAVINAQNSQEDVSTAYLLSWLVVNAAIFLLLQVFGGLNVLTGNGSIAEVYLSP